MTLSSILRLKSTLMYFLLPQENICLAKYLLLIFETSISSEKRIAKVTYFFLNGNICIYYVKVNDEKYTSILIYKGII